MSTPSSTLTKNAMLASNEAARAVGPLVLIVTPTAPRCGMRAAVFRSFAVVGETHNVASTPRIDQSPRLMRSPPLTPLASRKPTSTPFDMPPDGLTRLLNGARTRAIASPRSCTTPSNWPCPLDDLSTIQRVSLSLLKVGSTLRITHGGQSEASSRPQHAPFPPHSSRST